MFTLDRPLPIKGKEMVPPFPKSWTVLSAPRNASQRSDTVDDAFELVKSVRDIATRNILRGPRGSTIVVPIGYLLLGSKDRSVGSNGIPLRANSTSFRNRPVSLLQTVSISLPCNDWLETTW